MTKKIIVLIIIFLTAIFITLSYLETIQANISLTQDLKILHIKFLISGLLFLLALLTMLFLFKCSKMKNSLEKQLIHNNEYLNDQQARYKLLFNSVPEYIVLHDIEGKIFEYNNSFKQIVKNSDDNFFNYFKENHRLKSIFKDYDLSHKKSIGEFLLKVGNGFANVDLVSTYTEYSDTQTILTIVRDISTIKRMEHELYQAQKNEAIGTLAAGLSHDFKNILQNIKLYNQMISKSEDLDTVIKNSSMIDSIVISAFDYISNLLKLSKNSPEEYLIFEVADEVKENILILERVMPSNISMSIFNHAGSAKIHVVKSRFSQLLINLCVNAKEAIKDKNGLIEVLIELETVKMLTFIKISISDNGSGISAEEMKLVFDPFYTTKGNDGTGLGLTMVRRAIRDFGGFITLDSQAGKGTAFNIYLPEHIK